MIIFHSFSFFSPWQEKVSADGVAAQVAPQEAPNQDVWRARDRKGWIEFHSLLQNGFGIIREYVFKLFWIYFLDIWGFLEESRGMFWIVLGCFWYVILTYADIVYCWLIIVNYN